MSNVRGQISDGLLSTSAEVFPGGDMRPRDHGYKFWSYDIANAGSGGGTVVTFGTVYLTRINTPGPSQACTGVDLCLGTAGTVLTGIQAFEVCNPSGTVLATSPDQTANWGGTGIKSVTGLSFSTIADSFLWIVLLSAAGSTAPGFSTASAKNAGAMNVGLTTANFRAATNVTGQSALPTPFVPGSSSNLNNHIWAAIK